MRSNQRHSRTAEAASWLRRGFDPETAVTGAAEERVGFNARLASAAFARARSSRRPVLVGTVGGAVLAAVIAGVFLFADMRTPTGAYVLERARAVRAEARRPGMLTYERTVESYWERNPAPEGSIRSFALTGTVITETWRSYDQSRARIEQWVEGPVGTKLHPMSLVKSGQVTTQMTTEGTTTAVSQWTGSAVQAADTLVYRIHKAISMPAFRDCALCHAVTASSNALDGFTEQGSLPQALLSFGLLKNVGKDEIDGNEVWVLRSEGTTQPADEVGLPDPGRMKWLLEMYVDVDTYQLRGAHNRAWQGTDDGPLSLEHEWRFELDVSEAVATQTVPAGWFDEPTVGADVTAYQAVVDAAETGAYDGMPLYWFGDAPRVPGVIEPGASLLDGLFTVRAGTLADEEDPGPFYGERWPFASNAEQRRARITYATAEGNQFTIETLPAITPDALRSKMPEDRWHRTTERTVQGRPVTIAQSRTYNSFTSAPGPWRAEGIVIHFPDAAVSIHDLPGVLMDGLVDDERALEELVAQVRRWN